MEGVLQVGEEVKVKLIEIDKRTGKVKLSRKALMPRPPRPEGKPEGNAPAEQAPENNA
jgi:polyribonucleotide nucleotidyltransferase